MNSRCSVSEETRTRAMLDDDIIGAKVTNPTRKVCLFGFNDKSKISKNQKYHSQEVLKISKIKWNQGVSACHNI